MRVMKGILTHPTHNAKRILLMLFTGLAFIMVGKVNAQNMKNFPSIISEHTTLDTGEYVVKGNNIVKNGATLTINRGTHLYFVENAVVQIEGGLNISGQKEDFVLITSLDPTKPGIGFSISYEADDKIEINYADFKHLKKPIKLNNYWLRP